MKNTIVIVIVLLSTAGCASRNQIRSLETQLNALQAQNDQLRNQATAGEAESGPVTKAKAGQSQMPFPIPAPIMAMSVLPGAVNRLDDPPQNVGSLYKDMMACEKTPLHYRVHNDSKLHYKLMLDGKPVVINGEGVLPFLPPGETVHLCLDAPGAHRLQGVGYIKRGKRFVEADRFSEPKKMGTADHGYHDWIR